MQTAQAFGQVGGTLSFFRSSYDDFAGYRAVINRLSGFLDSTDAAGQLASARIETGAQRLVVDSLIVKIPANAMLVENLSLAQPQASSSLIRGRSGIGKTTLLRAIAGLWPYVEGRVERPVDQQSLFLPQKPYLPLGTLCLALYYPAAMQTDGRAATVLRQCHVGHLVALLDEEIDWARTLSLGDRPHPAEFTTAGVP